MLHQENIYLSVRITCQKFARYIFLFLSKKGFVEMKFEPVNLLSFCNARFVSMCGVSIGGVAIMCCHAFGYSSRYLICMLRVLSRINSGISSGLIFSGSFMAKRRSLRPTWNTTSFTSSGF